MNNRKTTFPFKPTKLHGTKLPMFKARDPETGLTPKQLKAVLHYLENGCKIDAYIYAYGDKGRTKKQLAFYSYRVFHEPAVIKFIDEQQKLAISNTAITVERIANEMGKIAFANLPDFVTNSNGQITIDQFESLSEEHKACLKKAKMTRQGVEIELHDKLTALKLLGMYHGMFTDKTKEGKDSGFSLTMNM